MHEDHKVHIRIVRDGAADPSRWKARRDKEAGKDGASASRVPEPRRSSKALPEEDGLPGEQGWEAVLLDWREWDGVRVLPEARGSRLGARVRGHLLQGGHTSRDRRCHSGRARSVQDHFLESSSWARSPQIQKTIQQARIQPIIVELLISWRAECN